MPQAPRLKDFAELIRRERESLLKEWRIEVRGLPSAKDLDVPTLNDHVPTLLDEIADALIEGSDESISEAMVQDSPPAHGLQRLKDGFDIEEVVAEYNILRGTIHNLAERNGFNLQGRAFHILNRVLDGAIGLAVQTYATARAKEVQDRRDEYLAFIVHDLRTPLSAVSLAATMLERIAESDTKSEFTPQLHSVMNRNLAQLDSLIAKIVVESTQTDAEDGQRLELRYFDLWPIVERLGEELRPKLHESDTQFLNSVPAELSVYADAHLVQRILQNLVANAIEYTPEGLIEVGADQREGSVECWVSDNGCGIPEPMIEKVFDKLETDAEKSDGIGLGLAIVKSFVELHGGTVTVKSEVGVGSTFRFTLPNKA